MAREDDFHLVLSDQGEDLEQPDASTTGHRTAIWSGIFKAGSLVVAAAVIAFAVVVEDPRVLLADTTAFVAALSAPKDGARQETQIFQSSAAARAASQPPANEALANNDIAAPSQTADQRQTDPTPVPAQALLGQFQAWAAGQTAQAEVQPVQPAQQSKRDPVQADPAQPDPEQTGPVQKAKADPIKADSVRADPVDEARAEIRSAQHHRVIRRMKTARAEIRAKPGHRARVQREQDAWAQAQGPQDARAQVQRQQDSRVYYRPPAREPDAPVQTRPQTFLESIGLSPREY